MKTLQKVGFQGPLPSVHFSYDLIQSAKSLLTSHIKCQSIKRTEAIMSYAKCKSDVVNQYKHEYNRLQENSKRSSEIFWLNLVFGAGKCIAHEWIEENKFVKTHLDHFYTSLFFLAYS